MFRWAEGKLGRKEKGGGVVIGVSTKADDGGI